MQKFAIAHVWLKLDFWPSSQWYFSAFDGPTVKIQVWCHSTPGVVYKYVKKTTHEENRRFLWNAKLCINAFGLSRFSMPVSLVARTVCDVRGMCLR